MGVPGRWRRIARERMEILFSLADNEVSENPERARRYVELARRIGEKYRVRPADEWKRSFCRECNSYLKAGVTVDIEMDTSEGAAIHRCRRCGSEKRYPYSD